MIFLDPKLPALPLTKRWRRVRLCRPPGSVPWGATEAIGCSAFICIVGRFVPGAIRACLV